MQEILVSQTTCVCVRGEGGVKIVANCHLIDSGACSICFYPIRDLQTIAAAAGRAGVQGSIRMDCAFLISAFSNELKLIRVSKGCNYLCTIAQVLGEQTYKNVWNVFQLPATLVVCSVRVICIVA